MTVCPAAGGLNGGVNAPRSALAVKFPMTVRERHLIHPNLVQLLVGDVPGKTYHDGDLMEEHRKRDVRVSPHWTLKCGSLAHFNSVLCRGCTASLGTEAYLTTSTTLEEGTMNTGTERLQGHTTCTALSLHSDSSSRILFSRNFNNDV